jgi:hypothetical protein
MGNPTDMKNRNTDKNKIRELIATTIANARGWRNGVPTIKNVMDLLPDEFKKEVYEDADNIINELNKSGFDILNVKIKPLTDSDKKLNLLLSLAKDLRTAQKEFFKNHSVNMLKHCRKLEVQLDATITMIETEVI